MKKSTFAHVMLLTASCITVNTAWAADPPSESGEDLFKFHGCINCHGAEGKNPVSKLVPVLAGKPAGELYENAKKILSGKGGSEDSKLMHAAFYSAANCDAPPSDAQVESITAWLATQ